jgi:translation initiation factor IF-2
MTPVSPVRARTDGSPTMKPTQKFTAEQLRTGNLAMAPPTAQPGHSTGRGGRHGRQGHGQGTEEGDRLRHAGGERDEKNRRRNHRQLGRKDDEDDQGRRSGMRRRDRRKTTNVIPTRSGPVELELPITVRSFSEAAGVRSNELQRRLMAIDILATINTALTEEQAETLGLELGIEIKIVRGHDLEDDVKSVVEEVDVEGRVGPRPPIVTFMGHVDHGKTSLMDKIRSAKVAAGEAGGITQHIGAYQVTHETGDVITFLDTPGHEAFTAMRARGANVTDIVVLVVAADDGVMPQTEEAINHAKAAEVPIVVAMNKIDLAGAKIDRLQQQLSKFGLIPETWGGDTLMVGTSATTGQGISDLLESIMIVAELKDLKADPGRQAVGTCIESRLSEGRGVVATFLVQKGTLRKGDVVVCGGSYGKIRSIHDHRGEAIDEAGPSTPVQITGLDVSPAAGEQFVAMGDLSDARKIAETRRSRERALTRLKRAPVTLDDIFSQVKTQKVQELNLILKADVRGSLEAIRKELEGLTHAEVKVRIIHDGLGAVSEGDVLLAEASNGIVVGFNVVPDDRAASLAAEKGVEVRRYEIIYQLTDDVKKALEGLLRPETRETVLGRAVVQRVFNISHVGSVAGCRVVSGLIERNGKCRIIRDGTIIGAYPIDTLRRVKDDAKDVREGLECGIKLKDFNDIKSEDVLECFKVEEIKRTL